MRKLNLIGIVATLGVAFGLTSSAEAADAQFIYIRGKGGMAFYSNLEPVSSTGSFGMDLGFRMGEGFGIEGQGRINLSSSALEDSLSTSVNSVFIGISPYFAVTRDTISLSFGVGIGSLMVSTDAFSIAFTSAPHTKSSKSRLALVPSMQLDLPLTSALMANLDISYVAAMGESPKPGMILTLVGIGYRF